MESSRVVVLWVVLVRLTLACLMEGLGGRISFLFFSSSSLLPSFYWARDYLLIIHEHIFSLYLYLSCYARALLPWGALIRQ